MWILHSSPGVDISLLLDQTLRKLVTSSCNGIMQWSSAKFVLCIQISCSSNQVTPRYKVTLGTSREQWRPTELVALLELRLGRTLRQKHYLSDTFILKEAWLDSAAFSSSRKCTHSVWLCKNCNDNGRGSKFWVQRIKRSSFGTSGGNSFNVSLVRCKMESTFARRIEPLGHILPGLASCPRHHGRLKNNQCAWTIALKTRVRGGCVSDCLYKWNTRIQPTMHQSGVGAILTTWLCRNDCPRGCRCTWEVRVMLCLAGVQARPQEWFEYAFSSAVWSEWALLLFTFLCLSVPPLKRLPK